MDNNLMTVEQVAGFLQVCKETVRRYHRNGDLQCIKMGRSLRFTKEHLDEFIINFANKDLGEMPPEIEETVDEEEEYDEEMKERVAKAANLKEDTRKLMEYFEGLVANEVYIKVF